LKVRVKNIKKVGSTAVIEVEAEDGRGLTIGCGTDLVSDTDKLVELVKHHVRLQWDVEPEVEL